MQIHSSIFLIAALLLLILPLDWILAVVLAGLFHELCHIVMLYVLGGKIVQITMQTCGCVIETSRVGDWRQFASILAGPLGSFGLLLFCRTVPRIAVCGFFQGLFNLIPVLPLDGGRLLRLLLYRFFPDKAEAVLVRLTTGIWILLSMLLVSLSIVVSSEFWSLFFVLLLQIKRLPRKFPCKLS